LEGHSDGTNDSIEGPLVFLPEIVIDLQRTVEGALMRRAEILRQRCPKIRNIAVWR
jgi:hypothetical protein